MPFDWQKMFSPRQAPKDRGLTMQRAGVDTTGLDPAMKETLTSMRGAVGAGTPGGGTPVKEHNVFSDMIGRIRNLFEGKKQ